VQKGYTSAEGIGGAEEGRVPELYQQKTSLERIARVRRGRGTEEKSKRWLFWRRGEVSARFADGVAERLFGRCKPRTGGLGESGKNKRRSAGSGWVGGGKWGGDTIRLLRGTDRMLHRDTNRDSLGRGGPHEGVEGFAHSGEKKRGWILG